MNVHQTTLSRFQILNIKTEFTLRDIDSYYRGSLYSLYAQNKEITINIREEGLEKMLNVLDKFIEEEEIRKTNESVKSAYEQYQILLNLAKENNVNQ